MNDIIDIVRKNLPPQKKTTGKGWITFNCPACVAAGESRLDTKGRGGLIFTPTGGFSYHCFNCKTKCHWEPGGNINKPTTFFLRQLGLTNDELRKLKFKAWQLRGQLIENVIGPRPAWTSLEFPVVPLPQGAQSFSYWASKDNIDPLFLDAAEYINTRGNCFLKLYNYYWTPLTKQGWNQRIIIPFYWGDDIVGYVGRLFAGKGEKYFGVIPTNYLFNNRVINYNRSFVLVVEGPLDAIALDAVGVLGSELSKEQISWINSGNKRVVVVPDRDRAGQYLIDVALSEGWDVAFPEWGEKIGDPAEAVKQYGRIYTLKSILETREANKLAINVKRKRYM
jgi:hypothetical protein